MNTLKHNGDMTKQIKNCVQCLQLLIFNTEKNMIGLKHFFFYATKVDQLSKSKDGQKYQ